MDKADPKAIAAGLTEAQRKAVLNAREEDGYRWLAVGSARGLPVEIKSRSIDGHFLTELGEAVRRELERQP